MRRDSVCSWAACRQDSPLDSSSSSEQWFDARMHSNCLNLIHPCKFDFLPSTHMGIAFRCRRWSCAVGRPSLSSSAAGCIVLRSGRSVHRFLVPENFHSFTHSSSSSSVPLPFLSAGICARAVAGRVAVGWASSSLGPDLLGTDPFEVKHPVQGSSAWATEISNLNC